MHLSNWTHHVNYIYSHPLNWRIGANIKLQTSRNSEKSFYREPTDILAIVRNIVLKILVQNIYYLVVELEKNIVISQFNLATHAYFHLTCLY